MNDDRDDRDDRDERRRQLRATLLASASAWARERDGPPDRAALLARVERDVAELPFAQRQTLSEADRRWLGDRVCDDLLGYGPLQPLLDHPAVTEIMVLGPDTVYVETGGRKRRIDVRFNGVDHLRQIVDRMISPSGHRFDISSPYCDAMLPDGSRLHAIMAPLTLGGPHLTIRKFSAAIGDVSDLVELGTLDQRMAGFLDACVRSKQNMLFAGATGAGKTTTLHALSRAIGADERIVTIEDTPELNLQQKHVVRLLTRLPSLDGSGEVTLRDLLRNSLRMRPSRILLGEIRGPEALDYLQALSSGHRGCSGVLHAATPSEAVQRLETLALLSGVNLPLHAIRQQIVSGLDFIVQHEQMIDGSRKITAISEVVGLQDGQVLQQDLYRFEIAEATPDGNVEGAFKALRAPGRRDGFHRRGVTLDDAWFGH